MGKKIFLFILLTCLLCIFSFACEVSHNNESNTSSVNDQSGSNETTANTDSPAIENKVSEVRKLFWEMCENNGLWVEDNLGKDKTSDIVSVSEITAYEFSEGNMIKKSDIDAYTSYHNQCLHINNQLFNNNRKWYAEEYSLAKAEKFMEQMNNGYYRLFNENGSELILLYESNEAMYRSAETILFFKRYSEDECPEYPDMLRYRHYDMTYSCYDITVKAASDITNEELANKFFDSYREYISSRPGDIWNYFDELKIIDITFSEKTVGDSLVFTATFATNTNQNYIAGGDTEGTGEYEGLVIYKRTISIKKYNNVWYCTGIGVTYY